MPLKYLLDTNICIYIAKQKPLSILHRLEKIQVGELGMSIVTYAELLFGAEKSHHSKKTKEILGELCVIIPPIPLALEVGEHYARVRHYLEKKGKPIGNNDLWIASHALSLNVVLVSNNLKEFSRVPALKTENWV